MTRQERRPRPEALKGVRLRESKQWAREKLTLRASGGEGQKEKKKEPTATRKKAREKERERERERECEERNHELLK